MSDMTPSYMDEVYQQMLGQSYHYLKQLTETNNDPELALLVNRIELFLHIVHGDYS